MTGTVSLRPELGQNGPDGGPFASGTTDILSFGGISGIQHGGKTMFLTGVFLDSAEPTDPAPARLDFTGNDGFTTLSPQLRQTFFIGDGLTGPGTGVPQGFVVPATATRLFLGFADALEAGNPVSPHGHYGDNTGSVVANFTVGPDPGGLQVTLNPPGAVSAGAQWQVDGGSFQNSGATVTGLPTGNHTVAFKSVAGWQSPESQVVTIASNTTTNVSGTYTENPGALQVTINPPGAVVAGAQWQVDGGPFQDSGATVTGLPVGDHTVAFKTVAGWQAPENQVVTIASNTTTNASGAYTENPGALQVTITPPGAVTAGARWSVDGGVFQTSGATVTNLSAGTHTVTFCASPGWIPPANQIVIVRGDITSQVTVRFARDNGLIQWTTAASGQGWVDSGTWQIPNSWPASGAVVTIRHALSLSNALYRPCGDLQSPPLEAFPGTQGGYLELKALNLEPGGFLDSNIEILSLDGASNWSGGGVRAGRWQNNEGTVSGDALLRNKGTVTVTAPVLVARDGVFHNTNRIIVDGIAGNPSASLGIQAGQAGLLNESGLLPDVSEAVIELRGDATSIIWSGGGGGLPVLRNYGVLRRSNNALSTAPGTSTITIPVENHADSPRNRAGTVQVDRGTLVFDIGGFGVSTWHGMKAEIAPGAQIIMRGSHSYEAGTTTVTGGGVLRMEGSAGNYFAAVPGVTNATLMASPGKLECAGAELRDLVNGGSLTVTAPSRLFRVLNKGHLRTLTAMDFDQGTNGTPSDRSAVLEIAGGHVIYTGSFFNNYGLLQKTGSGTAELNHPTTHYGSGANLNIEVTGGTLFTSSEVYFESGCNIRVANGAEVHFNYRNYHEGGTLNFTGSGKYYLNAGAFLSTNTPEVPRIFNSAPGVFDCRGGRFDGPVTNTGEITVSAPSSFSRSFLGDNPITNAGTIRCLATSAGGAGSYSINLHALARIPCTPTSVLAFDVAGRPGDFGNWARLVQPGQTSITYDGRLRINFGNFTPVDGDRWLVIENQSGIANSGDFAGVEFTNVPAGFTPTFEKLPGGIRVGLNAVPAPLTCAAWFTAQNFPTPAEGAFDADPDRDGFENGLEAAFATEPQSAASKPAMLMGREIRGGDEFITARFTRPGAGQRPTELQWIGERSDDLASWTSDGVVMEFGPPDAQGRESVIVRCAAPTSSKARGFLRLRVQKSQ